ncbi:MAG: hypothetical protein JNK82_06220 [Myxococcaceae bacterium]|nr:hypothetical protein [Myxococcaceae bacterium]
MKKLLQGNRPFVLAFVLGAVVLTALPLFQKKLLNAPAPVRALKGWPAGRVSVVSFLPSPCDDAACVERQVAFARSKEHLDDTDGGVVWVTLSPADAGELIEELRAGWVQWAGTDAGTTPEEFARLPGEAVVDQTGALRGFWKDDPEGRGNAINAARLLWRHGVKP